MIKHSYCECGSIAPLEDGQPLMTLEDDDDDSGEMYFWECCYCHKMVSDPVEMTIFAQEKEGRLPPIPPNIRRAKIERRWNERKQRKRVAVTTGPEVQYELF